MDHPAYKQARGVYQRRAVEGMMSEEGFAPRIGVGGRAWSTSYARSMAALADRLRATGYRVEVRTTGPRGGSRWYLIEQGA